jgi:hypothetical protein
MDRKQPSTWAEPGELCVMQYLIEGGQLSHPFLVPGQPANLLVAIGPVRDGVPEHVWILRGHKLKRIGRAIPLRLEHAVHRSACAERYEPDAPPPWVA